MMYQCSIDPRTSTSAPRWLVYCGQSGSVVTKDLDRDLAEALCRRLNAEPYPGPTIRQLQEAAIY